MRPDLVVEREVGFDLLGELRRVGDLRRAEMLVLEPRVGAFVHAVGIGRSAAREDVLEAAAAVLRTRRLTTAQHA